MNVAAIKPVTHDIVVDEVFPHAPETIWKTLTTPELMGRWLKMTPSGFEATKGKHFTYQTTPAGAWDGVIHCEVLDVSPNQRLVYAWKSGHEKNVGYGSRLETIVTWTLSRIANGTRVRMVHSGFVLPRNDTALQGMGEGWPKVLQRIDAITAEHDLSKPQH
jgi:uncharacterized protein YndB with AHSA1/START domain